MNISNRQLAQVMVAQLKAGSDATSVARSLAAYLITERRSKDADAIVRDVERLLQAQGQVEVQITGARAISNELQAVIKTLFAPEAKKIIMNINLDPTVLGGVLVESGDQRLDLTVRRQIQRLINS